MIADVVVLVVVVVDVLLATLVFVSIARPGRAAAWLATLTGDHLALRAGTLSDSDVERLLRLARRAQPALLLLVFSWSFVAGAAIVWSRL